LFDHIKPGTPIAASDPAAMRASLHGVLRQMQEDLVLLAEQGRLIPDVTVFGR
jgi:hypothetical protein